MISILADFPACIVLLLYSLRKAFDGNLLRVFNTLFDEYMMKSWLLKTLSFVLGAVSDTVFVPKLEQSTSIQ